MYFCEREASFIWKKNDLEEVNVYINKQYSFIDIKISEEHDIECLKIIFNTEVNDKDIEIISFEYLDDTNFNRIDKKCFLADEKNELVLHLNEEYKTTNFKLHYPNIKNITNIQAFKRKYKGILIASRLDAFGARMHALITAMYLAKKTGFKFGFTWGKVDLPGGCLVDTQEEIFEESFLEEHSYNKKGMLNSQLFTFKSFDELYQKPYEKYYGYVIGNGWFINSTVLKDLDEKDYFENIPKIFKEFPFKEKYKNIMKYIDEKMQKIGDFIAIHIRNGDGVYEQYLREFCFDPIVFSRNFPVEIACHFIEKKIKENKKIILFSPDKDTVSIIKKYFSAKLPKDTLFRSEDFYTENLNEMQKVFFDNYLLSKSSILIHTAISGYASLAIHVGKIKAINFYNYFTSKENCDAIKYYFDRIMTHPLQKAASCVIYFNLLNQLNASITEKLDVLNKALCYDYANSAYRIMIVDTLIKYLEIQRADRYLKIVLTERKEEFLSILLRKLYGKILTYEKTFDQYLNAASPKYPYISYIAAKIALFQNNTNQALKFIEYSLQAENNNEEFISLYKDIKKSLGQNVDNLPLPFKYISQNLNLLPPVSELDIRLKEQDLINKKLNTKKLYKELNIKEDVFMPRINVIQVNSAKARIHSHLAYKLGSALIENSKSIKGYIRLPYVLSYIKDKHKKEQRIYNEKTKDNPSLKLPPLESYPDYKDALREKQCLTYKLGEALIENMKRGGGIEIYKIYERCA